MLSAFSCSIYLLFWAYRTWRDLKLESASEERVAKHPALETFKTVNPWLNTLGLLAPVFISTIIILPEVVRFAAATLIVVYLFSNLVYGVARLNPDAESFSRKQPAICTGIVVAGFILLMASVHLPGAFWLTSLLAGVPLAFVQQWLNNYWKSVEPADMQVRVPFNLAEMAVIIIGGALIGLVVAGMMMGVPN